MFSERDMITPDDLRRPGWTLEQSVRRSGWPELDRSRGTVIRTRSDVPLGTVRSGDTEMLQAALASGAQIISTDFPQVGMSARYGSDYVARLPDGGRVRCNPVNAPRSCREDRLEREPGRR